MLNGNKGDNLVKTINFKPPFWIIFSNKDNFGYLLIISNTFLERNLFEIKKEIEAPIKALINTITEPKYVPYKYPAAIESHEAGRIKSTINM